MMIQPLLTDLVFILTIDNTQYGFRTCSGLGSTTDVIELQVTDQYGHTVLQKNPGKVVHWSNLVLERGIDPSTRLWAWRQLVIDGKMTDARKTGVVEVMAADGELLRRWEFTRGWPCAWRASSDEDTSGIVIERIEIAHEGLRIV